MARMLFGTVSGMPLYRRFQSGARLPASAAAVGRAALLGAAWEEIISFVEVYQDVVLVVLVIALIAFVVLRLRGRFGRAAAR